MAVYSKHAAKSTVGFTGLNPEKSARDGGVSQLPLRAPFCTPSRGVVE